jgi:hypothetical protein
MRVQVHSNYEPWSLKKISKFCTEIVGNFKKKSFKEEQAFTVGCVRTL